MNVKNLPGFQLTIEDNAPQTEALPALRDVHVIYAVLPETMQYEDEDGYEYSRYIEPNMPILITSKEEALRTLTVDLSSVKANREVVNIIKLLPNDATIALCRVVNPEDILDEEGGVVVEAGVSPNPNSVDQMYKALEFAFENTENYPIKQIIPAGISLDFATTATTDGNTILNLVLKHNALVTGTQNNCMTFMSPAPPKNGSAAAIAEYVARCKVLHGKLRNVIAPTVNGSKRDLGMFLNTAVGVNSVDGIAGVKGFPQTRVENVKDPVAGEIAVKSADFAEVGDLVEVYTHDKLEILSVTGTVLNIVPTSSGADITIKVNEGEDLSTISGNNPIYVMVVNNKDFNGTYLAAQYSAICDQVGVKRSPAGIVWPGECQVRFSKKQLDELSNLKFCVLNPRTGTTQGEIEKSQLMTDPERSQFQDFENLKTIYHLVSGAKEIAMKYKGERLTEGADIGLIKKEIEDSVFNPAISDKIIYSGYKLELKLKMTKQPNGKREKTMHIGFEVKEVETLKLLTMSAKLF